MPTASRFFTRLTILVAILAAVSFLGPSTGQSADAGESDPLRPDLKTARPGGVELVRDSSEAGGADILKFSNRILNAGIGPLEMQPEGDCPNSSDENDRMALQRVFLDSNENGTFNPKVDVTGQETQVGCTRYHPQHFHWHLDDFALYELFALDEAGNLGSLVASSDKVGFCLVDTLHLRADLPGSPAGQRYEGRCFETDPTGISVGWADKYGADLWHQWVVLPDKMGDGAYCLKSTADPSDQLDELKEGNNSSSLRVVLDGDTARFKPRVGCL